MSNGGSAALALVLGASGGLALSYLLRDRDLPVLGGAKASNAKTSRTDSGPAASSPAATGACSLKLDRAGLWADGQRVDVPGAVARCRRAGRAELALAKDGPAIVYVELSKALAQAGVPVTVRRA